MFRRITDFGDIGAGGIDREEAVHTDLGNYGMPYQFVAWNLLDWPCDDLVGWAVVAPGGGIAEILPPGYFHVNPAVSNFAYAWQDIGSLPESGYSVEFKINISSFGTYASGNYCFVRTRDGVHYINFHIASDFIALSNAGGGVDTFALVTNFGINYYWLLVVNSNAHSVKVYRSTNGTTWTYITEFTSLFNDAGGDGEIYVGAIRGAGGNCEAHYDYVKIGSGAFYPDYARNSKGYAGTGYNLVGAYTKDWWEYDPWANTWTQKADYGGTARVSATGFQSHRDGALFVGTGNDGARKLDFYRYCPTAMNSFGQAANSWVAVTNIPGLARRYCSGTGVQGFGYVYGGMDGPIYNVFYEYDCLNDSWVALSTLGIGARCYQNFVGMEFNIGYDWEGFLFAMGGSDGVIKKDTWVYNAIADIWIDGIFYPVDSWTQKVDYPHNMYVGLALIKDKKVFFGLGHDSVAICTDIWEFEPAQNVYYKIADPAPFATYTLACFTMDEKRLYYGTGRDNNPNITREFHEFMPWGTMKCKGGLW